MEVALQAGSRLPAYCTSMGRVLLASQPSEIRAASISRTPLVARTPKTLIDPDQLQEEMTRVASQGHALIEQELQLGLRSLAVPIRSASGLTIAAINTGTNVSEVTVDDLIQHMLPVLCRAAGKIAANLGN